jgi:hypothetical protein
LIKLGRQLAKPSEVAFEGQEHVVKSTLTNGVEILCRDISIDAEGKYKEKGWEESSPQLLAR